MRIIFWIVFGTLGSPLLAQLQLFPIQPSENNQARIDAFISPDTITLPFWDDFSSSSQLDTTQWLYGPDVFINSTHGINPPTWNVATFDGINQYGKPYVEDNEYNGAGDSLVSMPIDLSQVPENERNSVYFSFFWQAKGNGEIPEDNDSLRLQFYTVDSTWVTQNINPGDNRLSLIGGLSQLKFDEDSVLEFQQVLIPIVNPLYFHAGFKFRFQSFISRSGLYDSWHIDYIYLNKDRSQNDITHFDRAISSINSSLFYPYVAIPVDQFLANPDQFLAGETITLSNLDNTFHPARFSYQLTNLTNGVNGVIEYIVSQDMKPLEIGRQILVDSYDLPAVTVDSTIIESTITYITGDKQLFEKTDPTTGDTLFLTPNLAINDTVRRQYVLHNYLAYDDGSAEFAAAINLNEGQIAVAFYLPNPDTLTDILINFPAVSPSTVGESVTVKVWTDLTDLGILRQFDGVIQSLGRDEFQQFTLTTPIIVRDTFYLGFEQKTDNYVGIGFDANNTGGTENIYTNTNFNWVKNTYFQGSLLIRPLFKSAADFILANREIPSAITFFPNPVFSTLQLNQIVDQVSIYTLNGTLLLSSSNTNKLQLDNLPKGLYVLRLTKGNQTLSERLIKK
jgi:hypothetical protein